jgi:hypothetical protein
MTKLKPRNSGTSGDMAANQNRQAEELRMLTCKTCKQQKPAAAYWRQKNKKSGYFAECKLCQRQRNQAWIDANRARFRHLNRAATNAKRRRDPIRNMLSLAKARCKKSGLEFALAIEDITVPELCPILGELYT